MFAVYISYRNGFLVAVVEEIHDLVRFAGPKWEDILVAVGGDERLAVDKRSGQYIHCCSQDQATYVSGLVNNSGRADFFRRLRAGRSEF